VKKATKDTEGSLQVIANARVLQTVKLVRLEKFLSVCESIDQALETIKKS